MRSSGASGFVILLAFWLIGILALTLLWPSMRPGPVPARSTDATLAVQDRAINAPSAPR